MTLLLNRQSFLPLDKEKIKSVAVIGPAAGDDYETGNYYGTPFRKVSVTRGLESLLGKGIKVEYEKGAGYTDPLDQKAIDKAADLARKSDVVILCLGTNLRIEAEGRDRRNLDLPGAQEQLLEAVYAANPKTVLVLENAGPLAVTWAHDHLPAILSAWYPGEGAGDTIARTLFGVNNPSGHLPYTVYQSLDGVPPQNEYDVSKGYTYMYFKGLPLYPFGHGLSYTTFTYSNLKVTQSSGKLTVTFDLKNSGDRAGAEVAQFYTHQRASSTYQPIKSLRAFQRVTLDPGQSKTVSLEIPVKQLAFYDAKIHDFRVEPGIFDVLVGSSSDDIRLRGETTVKSPALSAGTSPKPAQ
jgi:beta-glucosidase